MLKRILLAGGLLTLGLLTACAPAPTPAVVPPTLPPAVPVTPATAAPTPTPLSRATLPPTWTPVIVPTATPTIFQPTPNATETALMLTPTLTACFGFGEDPEQSPTSFPFGQPVTVYWLPVQGAANYRVTVLSPVDDRILFTTETPTLQQELPADIFTADSGYFWQVAPIDSSGLQLCPAAISFILPTL